MPPLDATFFPKPPIFDPNFFIWAPDGLWILECFFPVAGEDGSGEEVGEDVVVDC